ncbi:MAG: CpaF family protein [Gordonibacter sp.]|uniref:CpaF family protein n=1 Tax=Gordonibacter sp. TaxID=1968902 RepID=UPI002FCACF61
MSLLERVRQAGNDVPPDGAAGIEPGFDRLREQVQLLVSVDEVAALQAENPERARNEVRSACRRVFGRMEWSRLSAERRRYLESELIDAIFGFGPLEALLADDAVTEIMVNGPKKVFFERDGRLCRSAQEFADDGQLRALIDRVLGPLGRRIDESSPMVNARLPQGHRVHAIIPPLALDGPVLTIRKFTKQVMTLEDMVAKGSFDQAMMWFLTWAVRARKSVAVSGGTGSGKTTLLNALSCVIPPEERIITIEDSAELRFLEHPHVVRLEARPRNAEGCGEVTIRDLVTNALRMRPDRIVVGECRGAEALDMLQAMNTGHDGSLTTLHANSPEESIARLTTLVRYGADLPVDVIEANIASAIDVVVQTARSLDGSRRVSEVVAFSYDREKRHCAVEHLFERGEGDRRGHWFSAPSWVAGLASRGSATEKEVEAWMRACCLAA